jgi:dTDP-4-dehydrorhamnose reductase
MRALKILLFGKSGQLGTELSRSLASLGELVVLTAASTDYCGDLADPSGIGDSVRSIRPQIIVNAAAWTDVDKAEAAPEAVRRINTLAPAAMAQAAGQLDSWMLHFSSDYVFDGSGERPWTEGDPPEPLNVYGRSKFEGDKLVVLNCPKHLIFRISWLYSARSDGFAARILRQARERDTLDVVADQIGAPTGADWIADIAARVLGRIAEGSTADLPGLYHLAASGHTSWHCYARFVLECAQRAGRQLRSGPDAIRAVASEAYPSTARRPHNSRLDTSKFRTAFGLACPPWQEGVERLVRELA